MKRWTRLGSFIASVAVTLLLAGPLTSAAPAQTQPADTPGQSAQTETQQAIAAANAAATRHLDQMAARLDEIAATLRNHNASEAELQSEHDRIGPLILAAQDETDRLTARLTAVKARLDQLGKAPDANAPKEAPEITKERAQQTQEYEEVDALVKRAKLILVQAQQFDNIIGARQHAQFAHSLFERNASLADPALWLDISAQMPHAFKTAVGAVGDWIGVIDSRLSVLPALGFWLIIGLLFLAWRPLAVAARLVLLRRAGPAQPGRFRKITMAWWIALIIAGYPLLVLLLIWGFIHAIHAFDVPQKQVFFVVTKAIAYVSIAIGAGQALLAPKLADWRLIGMTNASAYRTFRTMVAIAVLLSLSHLIHFLSGTIHADAGFEGALRGAAALLVALVIVGVLYRAGTAPPCDTEDIFGPRLSGTRDWYGLLQFFLWSAAIVIIVALFAGYLRLGEFLAQQIYWIGAVTLAAIMSLILIKELVAAGLRPESRFGHALMASAGLHSESIEQLAILSSGLASVTIFVAAALIILAPWGIQSGDLPGYLHAAFFGFRVGDITISLSSIILAVIMLLVGIAATRVVVRWLDTQFLPHTRLDYGLRNAIKTSCGYVGIIFTLGFALGYLGLSFEKLAIVAGALSVGIGFGLQSIVNNFVSGLIILWERTIRVGDWIVVGADEGVVSRISVRATEIATFDRAAVIVPNANLVAGVVKNFVRTDRSGRVQISIPVNAAADPQVACNVLLEIARDHRLVLDNPAPQVVFTGITPSAFNFDLYCFIPDVGNLGATKSELNFEIYRRFKAANLFAAPPPESVVRIADLDKFGPLLHSVVAGNGLGRDEKPS